jgi:hypothetical protein
VITRPRGALRRRLLPAAVIVLLAGTSTGCTVDKSQWSPQFRDPTPSSGSSRAASLAAAQRPTPPSAPSRPQPLGVQAGAPPGAAASRPVGVVVRTGSGTCWAMVVDGNASRGCGPASATDTRGAAAARLTRVSGGDEIVIGLISAGRTVAQVSVPGSGAAARRPATITGRR